jgi:hypothetical protein
MVLGLFLLAWGFIESVEDWICGLGLIGISQGIIIVGIGLGFFPFLCEFSVKLRDFDIFGSFKVEQVNFHLFELNLNVAFPQHQFIDLLCVIPFEFAFLFGQHFNFSIQLINRSNALTHFLLQLVKFLPAF